MSNLQQVSTYLLETGQSCTWFPGNGCAMYANGAYTSDLATLVVLSLTIPFIVVYFSLVSVFTIGCVILICYLSNLALVLTWQALNLPLRILNRFLAKRRRRRERIQRFERMTAIEFLSEAEREDTFLEDNQ